ncbi:MAG: hypothetical protein A3A08_01610 [Candidatus Nealsonbacteria bacterium RIFCSPLOWO2_01_FULL_41_9]|uniref:Uncharacterized protein n=1 Tax=Candidatus Nealsonbacteria bacterium RIFCSPLOWO2_01_FULL_41_9 TaxID=1801671 RepID=A0A1G2ECL0_9BACT|nr:MAG: hypothetical protein A3A08_01610 [Candidatus Nealsonbacteria bacterium RIFCSPLOWO2_01_FULL_41_9]
MEITIITLGILVLALGWHVLDLRLKKKPEPPPSPLPAPPPVPELDPLLESSQDDLKRALLEVRIASTELAAAQGKRKARQRQNQVKVEDSKDPII